MTDIVERLRYCHDNGLFDASRSAMTAGYGEAADTIERLRAECNHLYKKLNDANDMLQEIAASEENYKSENARLTKERDDFHMQYRAVCDEEVKIYVVEIERLREENARLRDLLKECADDLEDAVNDQYGHIGKKAMPDRYERDMQPVIKARDAIREGGKKDE